MKKILILVGIVVVIGGAIWFSKGGGSQSMGSQATKYNDPADATSDFYNQWLKAAQSASAIPDKATLAKLPVVSSELSAKLTAALQAGTTPDPVLCQSVVPQGITLRNVYVQGDDAQMLVTSKDKSVTNQAVITLNKTSDSWVINKIDCNNGEVAPVKEFTFEQEGFLIKSSVPKPFNNKNWHIVFTQEGKAGNVVPLLFDSKSQCTSIEGVKSVCKPDTFVEANKVLVHGQMTEKGATVVSMEFVK